MRWKLEDYDIRTLNLRWKFFNFEMEVRRNWSTKTCRVQSAETKKSKRKTKKERDKKKTKTKPKKKTETGTNKGTKISTD